MLPIETAQKEQLSKNFCISNSTITCLSLKNLHSQRILLSAFLNSPIFSAVEKRKSNFESGSFRSKI